MWDKGTNPEIKPKFAGFGEEYFRTSKEDESNNEKPIFQGYKSVLNSKASEETLVGNTSFTHIDMNLLTSLN